MSWDVEDDIVLRGRDCDALTKKKILAESLFYFFIESSRISGQFLAGYLAEWAEQFEKNLETHCLESGLESGRKSGQNLAEL